MNRIVQIVFAALLLGTGAALAQVSHGGSPLAWEAQPGVLSRSVEKELFVEMPAFDVAEELRIDSLNESDLRSGYRFAYKFMTDYRRTNSGVTFTLPDGTRVWRLGIRSAGALSLNLLFTEYELPEGAQLFLYTPERNRVLGAFTHLNNSELGILPVAPLPGDEVIVEYQEPAQAAFPGKLTLGEVNHGYRSLKGDEPRPDRTDYKCMPPLSCFLETDSPYEALGRSVVMMLIDGSIACSGTLVNNKQNDGKPYLLTASHCLNRSFTVTNPDYQKVAGRIVFFFHYDSPTCNPVMRGAEELSVASARCTAVNEKTDLALLELLQRPPVYYQPYYAGWNASRENTPPYAGIHHPGGTVKRISWAENPVELTTFEILESLFNKDSHWHVKEWSVGCTAGGSSGSSLFDATGRLIGALSGGASNCTAPVDDYYYALCQSWTVSDEEQKQLKHWLDPDDTGELLCEGLDPYESAPCYRLSNVANSGAGETIETTPVSATNTEPLFGNNSLGTTEYAEAYTSARPGKLYGAYFTTPAVTGNYKELQVEVTVYTGNGKPQALLHTQAFHPTYQNLNLTDDSFQQTGKPLNRAQETYILFDQPVDVEGDFYVGYRISAPEGTLFSAYNLPKGSTTRNTAWVHNADQWVTASAYAPNPFSTSLCIDPVLQYDTHVGTETIETTNPIHIYTDTDGNRIHILLPEEVNEGRFALFTSGGALLQTNPLRGNLSSVTLNSPVRGTYIVKIECKDRKFSQKIIF